MSHLNIEPICTIEVYPWKYFEAFSSGKEFMKGIYKHTHHEKMEKIVISFGHKFFHWVNTNTQYIYICNKTGMNLGDYNSWSLLSGELKWEKVSGKKIFVIYVNNAKINVRH